jgi:hypothetical protein
MSEEKKDKITQTEFPEGVFWEWLRRFGCGCIRKIKGPRTNPGRHASGGRRPFLEYPWTGEQATSVRESPSNAPLPTDQEDQFAGLASAC